MLGGLIDRFRPVLGRIPGRIEIAEDETADALTIDQAGTIRVVWVPFEYVPKHPVLAIVGITPGRYQGEIALNTFRDVLNEGLGVEDALRRVKATASFSGPMRSKLVAMLDHIGLNHVIGVMTCADIFGAPGEPVHTTSAMRYPVFVDGKNYSGSPDIIRTPILRRWVETTLAEEATLLPNVLWVPLGRVPAVALRHLSAKGMIDGIRVLDGLPHPSGANAERVAYFLRRKPREALSRLTNPDPIDSALAHLRQQVDRLRRSC
jgi:hypothetical protein